MKRSRTTLIAAFAIAALSSTTAVRAQLPMPAATPFEMTGFIQSATLDAGADPFRGGSITLNNHTVVVPRNTIFQMPATSLTWAELFGQAPALYRSKNQTGLALNDTPKSDATYEVTVQGNRVGDTYIAGLLFLDQLSLMAHQGFVNYIDYAAGELHVGGKAGSATSGTRVRINDPIGRFGRAATHDARFTIDEDNPTIKSETGYPMCLPRTNPATQDDPKCPQGNRPIAGGKFQTIFTMPVRPEPTAAERSNPAPRATPDPWRMAPFEIGDYVTVKGPIVVDDGGEYVDAWGIDANVGIFTTPGTMPAYVAVDVLLMGTGPLDDPLIAQEGAKRTRVEGFTTDISTAIYISAVDVNACTGEAVDRLWNLQAVDPGPPNGAVAGRWRFRPGAPLFDLKGFPFLPPTRDVHVVGLGGTVTTIDGLSAGEYTAPNFEFILPENLGIGNPKVAGNFETMEFLTQGSGPHGGTYSGQLSPWPGVAKPVRKPCALVGPDQTVNSGTTVALDGSTSPAANEPAGPVTYQWSQVSGPAVTLANATTPSATFVAPKEPAIPVGSEAALTFGLHVSATDSGAAIDSRAVTVTVKNPDLVAPTVGAVSTNPTAPLRAKPVTVSVTATDNVGVTGVTFFYSYTQNNVKQTGVAIGTRAASPANTWTATFTMPNLGSTYTFTATASDAAGRQTTTGPLTKTVQ